MIKEKRKWQEDGLYLHTRTRLYPPPKLISGSGNWQLTTFHVTHSWGSSPLRDITPRPASRGTTVRNETPLHCWCNFVTPHVCNFDTVCLYSYCSRLDRRS